MASVKISMHRLLGMLKANEDIINKANNKSFVHLYVKSQGKVAGVPAREVDKEIKAEYQSVRKLIKNNSILRAARAVSNAQTIVSISGKEYTVADAIARKQNLDFEKNLLKTLVTQYASVRRSYDIERDNLTEATSRYIASLINDKSVVSADKIAQLEKDYRELHEKQILDPIGIAEEIKKLEKDINDFETEVDYVLSDSNASTFVEVDLDD